MVFPANGRGAGLPANDRSAKRGRTRLSVPGFSAKVPPCKKSNGVAFKAAAGTCTTWQAAPVPGLEEEALAAVAA